MKRTKKINIFRCNRCWLIYEMDPALRYMYECPRCGLLLTLIGTKEIEIN